MPRKLPLFHKDAKSQVRTMEDLGYVVRNQRAGSNLRIDDAAALCTVSSDLFSRLENGKPVTVDKLFKVLNGLGLRMLIVASAKIPELENALDPTEAHDAQR